MSAAEQRLLERIERLERELRTGRLRRTCRACGGIGVIEGFWLGTWKTCPACHGKGEQ